VLLIASAALGCERRLETRETSAATRPDRFVARGTGTRAVLIVTMAVGAGRGGRLFAGLRLAAVIRASQGLVGSA
jgi:hypothetical protein